MAVSFEEFSPTHDFFDHTGFGNNRTQPTGSSEPDDDDDGMQKKSENVAHAQDGIKRKKLKNSRHLRNSPPTRVRMNFCCQHGPRE